MLKINVTTAEAVIQETELITAGRRGLVCFFSFDSAWDGLAKTIVVQGVVKRDVVLTGDSITVPGECIEKENYPLKIGVYGSNGAGTIVIPTVWANFGKILPSAKRSDIPPDELTPDIVAQIQQNANNALYLAQNVSNRANSGAFNGVSPTVLVSSITGGHEVDITDLNGTQTFNVMDGVDGQDGTAIWYTYRMFRSGDEPPYQYSARVAHLTGSEELTPKIGDYVFGPETGNGEPETPNALFVIESFSGETLVRLTYICNIKGETGPAGADGADGADGVGVPAGGTTGQVLKKHSGTDYDTEWADESGGGGGGAVDSVNGQTGDVVLTASDVGALADSTTYVSSVNSQTGAVSLSIPSTAGDVGAIPAPASPSADDVLTYSNGAWAAAAPAHQIPAGGNAGECLAKNSSSDYDLRWRTINDWTPAGLMRTAGGTAAKVAEWSLWSATQYPAWLVVTVGNSNTYAGAITLKVNGSTAYPIYINGAASSATNYSLPAGSYLVYFDGTNMYFRTDGIIPGTEPKEVTISTAGAVTQAIDAGKLYHFTGALTSLTITLNAASAGQLAEYHFDFDSGSTAPTVTLPGTVTMQGGTFTPEASKHYEIDILNGYGVSMAW